MAVLLDGCEGTSSAQLSENVMIRAEARKQRIFFWLPRSVFVCHVSAPTLGSGHALACRRVKGSGEISRSPLSPQPLHSRRAEGAFIASANLAGALSRPSAPARALAQISGGE